MEGGDTLINWPVWFDTTFLDVDVSTHTKDEEGEK